MEKKIKKMHVHPWTGLTCLVAGALAVNACQAIRGQAPFAWWHLITLTICVAIAWDSYTVRERQRISAHLRLARQKAAKTFLSSARAVRCLPALFAAIFRTFRTEP